MADGKGFLGQNWSWENLKGKFGDIMNDPGALTSNPMFTGGMGLLSASRDARIDPFQAAVQGIQSGKEQQQSDEDRKRMEELRKKLAALIAAQTANQGVPGQPPPTAQEQALQMSLNPGQPGSSLNAPLGINPQSRTGALLQQLGLRNMTGQ